MIIKKKVIIFVDKDVGKLEPSYTGMSNGAVLNSLAVP